ncbi:hypothetical protein I4U23_003589 [Adineta vaga]|nr:hypothetical protein I4U23_003589 [Adineta vaga]
MVSYFSQCMATSTYIHALIGYQGQANGCSPTAGTFYDLFYSMYSIVTAISPMVIMSVFSILTIMNVRMSVRQVQPIIQNQLVIQLNELLSLQTNDITKVRRRRDRQLIRLAFVQVVSYIILNITTSIYPLYFYLKRSQISINQDEQAISNFISSIGLILLYTFSAATFFLYTIASTVFRQECVIAFKQRWMKMKRLFEYFT